MDRSAATTSTPVGQHSRQALLVAVLAAPALVPTLVVSRSSDSGRALVWGLYGLVLDFALTFVTPALALSTDSAWQAVKLGVSVLGRLWPRDAMYVIVPPLALTIVARLAPAAFGSALEPAAAGAVAQMLTLLFAGATTLLYVREVDPDAGPALKGRLPAPYPIPHREASGERSDPHNSQ